MPSGAGKVVTDMIAGLVYFPFAKVWLTAEKVRMNEDLSVNRNKSIYTMRTGALGRFSTRVNKCFTVGEVP